MRLRTVFLAILGIIILWVLYIQREILTPFVLAAIFAYISNPLVNLLSQKIKLPRTLSVIIIYISIIGLLIFGGWALTQQIIEESSQFENFVRGVAASAKSEVANLPEWAKPVARDTIASIDKTKILALSPSIISIFPQAISRIISFIIFLFAAFFFLKEGRRILDRFLNFLPKEYRIELEILLRKIDRVLGDYFRGQLLLVVFVSIIYFISLSALNVKFALYLAVFSGIAEIIPIIGPITGALVSALVAFVSGSGNFGLSPLHTSGVILAIYFVTNQVQEYIMKPFILGKITKLHPLVVLFAVLAGGSMAGMLGLILAVPAAAVVRILLEFSFDKISDNERRTK